MKKENRFWGLFCILAAVLLLAGGLGILPRFDIFRLLAAVFLAAWLVKSLLSRSITGTLFSLAFLCIVFDDCLRLTALTPWPILAAALLGSIGFSLLFPGKNRHTGNPDGHPDFPDNTDFPTENVEGQHIRLTASFGGSVKYIRSEDFQSADIRCSFGSMKVYFDNATVSGNQAKIHVDASFSGVELYLPRTWKVYNQMSTSFGGVQEKNPPLDAQSPCIYLTGNAAFSGVNIVYI